MINKIFNWTIGSVFRTIGRFLGFLLIGSLLVLFVQKNDIKITDLLGIEKVNAKSVSITSQSYSIRHYNVNTTDYIWTSYVSNGTQTQINTSTYWTLGFRSKFYSSSKFDKDTSYQLKLRLNTTPKGTYGAFYPSTEFSCYGSISNSNYSAETSLIKSCQLVSVVIESDNNFTDYYINFTPNSNIETFQVVILWVNDHPITRLNVDSSSTITYDTSTQDAINSQTNSLINNQNSNTNTIINNNNQNTQDIINNQNSNTQQQIESQKVCKQYDKTNIKESGKYLNISGNFTSTNAYGITDYINVYNGTIKETTHLDTTSQSSMCFYNVNKTLISCLKNNNINGNITLPANTYYVRLSININEDKPQFEICTSGNQAINDSLNNLNDTLNDNTLNDSDISNSLNSLNVESESFGVFSTFLTLPLTWVRNLLANNQTCSPINIPLPYMENKYLTLPCMSNFWQSLGALNLLIQACWLCVVGVRIFNGLFLLTVDTISSDDNVDHLTKIKSWEL